MDIKEDALFRVAKKKMKEEEQEMGGWVILAYWVCISRWVNGCVYWANALFMVIP